MSVLGATREGEIWGTRDGYLVGVGMGRGPGGLGSVDERAGRMEQIPPIVPECYPEISLSNHCLSC